MREKNEVTGETHVRRAILNRINPKREEYPEGTNINRWVLVYEKQVLASGEVKSYPRIRRWVYYPDGTKRLERYPSSKYSEFADNQTAMQDFLIRLNGFDPNEQKARHEWRVKCAHVSPLVLEEYLNKLRSEVPSVEKANAYYGNLEDYFLDFFVNKMRLKDPLHWHRHQTEWGKALINDDSLSRDNNFKEEWRLFPKGKRVSGLYIKQIVQVANRFMRFLHQKRPDEVPPLQFAPVTRAMLKKIDANRKLDGEVLERHFIPDRDWKVIEKEAPKHLKKFVQLGYYYGLRRGESMAVGTDSLFKGYLRVFRQLINVPDGEPVYGPLKSREERKIPHWYIDAPQAYKIITQEVPILYHPDTLIRKFSEFMSELRMPYHLHDLRHTWITKSIRRNATNPRDVQLAAGHADITTTLRYLHDDREMGDELFVPDEE